MSAAPDDTAWMRDAACHGQTDMFFPPAGDLWLAARRVCAGCPVRTECLDYALRHRVEHGVWGGVSEERRAKLLRYRPVRRYYAHQAHQAPDASCDCETCVAAWQRILLEADPGRRSPLRQGSG